MRTSPVVVAASFFINAPPNRSPKVAPTPFVWTSSRASTWTMPSTIVPEAIHAENPDGTPTDLSRVTIESENYSLATPHPLERFGPGRR